ncbi:MAG: nucleotidyltransferase domain-containing protein [Planctomycetota bacterium]
MHIACDKDMKELSKNRAELLKVFLTNPERSFYLQELGRLLGKKPGVFQRTINRMEEQGILTSQYQANARYFRANKNYPLYQELKSIIFKTVGIAGALKDLLGKTAGSPANRGKTGTIKYAFIYGSYAKKLENHSSDVDLIIVGRCDEDELIRELDKLEKRLRREINYKLYTPETFRREIRQKEPFLKSILKDKKIMLIGAEDELRRIS